MSLFSRYKSALLTFVLVYIFLLADYYLTSVGIRPGTLQLQMRRYLPCAAAVALAVQLWLSAGLSLKRLLPHAFAGVVWTLVFPLCYYYAYHSTYTFIDKHYDQAFGAYFFAFSVCLRLLLLRCSYWQERAWMPKLFGALHTCALLIPLAQIAYFAVYRYPITESTSILILQTNPAEAKEYLLMTFGYAGIIGALVLLAVLYYCFKRANRLMEQAMPRWGRRTLAMGMVVLLATLGYGVKMFKDTGVMQTLVFAKQYFDRAREFERYHGDNYAKLLVEPEKPAFAKPSTVIMVIGESSSAYYMSAYHDTKNDNTPWLRSRRVDDNFVLFNHAYTSACATVPSLERALTEKNQYNDKDFSQCLTVLDIAKKAGYETYWFSNQGYISDADTPARS